MAKADGAASITRIAIAAFVVLTALGAVWLGLIVESPRVSVNVRWNENLTAVERSALEQRFHLTDGRLVEGGTWQYTLADDSSANIRALVEHPAVADTYRLNRVVFQPSERPPSKTWQVIRGAVLIGLTGTAALLIAIAFADSTRVDLVLLLILISALAVRLELATTEEYIHDEENTSIPLSKTISFAPDHLHLPIRGENHGALPAYVVKVSSSLFGTSPLGYRLLHLLLGICTIIIIFLATRQWYGPVAARWAAALWAFNEYYLAISARATAQVPTLFFDALAVYAFSRFLSKQRAVYLYAAGFSVGLAFYCKENAALLLPIFLLTLLHTRYRQWLRSPHVYLACLTFFVVIGPDVYVNLTTDPETARITYSDQIANQATYGSHFRRFGGIAFSPYPAMFYGRSAVRPLYRRITGGAFRDETSDYLAMNPGIGILLFGAVLITTIGPGRDSMRWFLLLLFWVVFVFFSLIKPGDPPGRLDPVSWIWVEVTMIPAVVLAGARLADATGKWRVPAWAFGAGVLLYAVASTIGQSL